MIQQHGLWFPDDVGEKWRHALMHLGSVEWAIAHARRRRTVVQAGGNVGLWPRRLAQAFDRVITFEPDAASRACLEKNVPATVEVHGEALGAAVGVCGLAHRSLGSHRVTDGDTVTVTTVDALGLQDLDYLQLDVEGYEWHALQGARDTLRRCRPLVQVELRDMTQKYGQTDAAVRADLASLGYRPVSRQQGSDVVFAQEAA